MKKVFDFITKNAPIVKHYASLAIHFIDMLDGVQDWQKNNPIDKKVGGK